MSDQLKIEFLDTHRQFIPTLKSYFESEWNEYYGPEGPGNALDDIKSLCNQSILPIGLIALKDNAFSGTVALRYKTASHQHLSPWVTSLFVVSDDRRMGIGTKLIEAVEKLSIQLGYSVIYARSATAVNFFRKNNWIPFDRILFSNEPLMIFKKLLR